MQTWSLYQRQRRHVENFAVRIWGRCCVVTFCKYGQKEKKTWGSWFFDICEEPFRFVKCLPFKLHKKKSKSRLTAGKCEGSLGHGRAKFQMVLTFPCHEEKYIRLQTQHVSKFVLLKWALQKQFTSVCVGTKQDVGNAMQGCGKAELLKECAEMDGV